MNKLAAAVITANEGEILNHYPLMVSSLFKKMPTPLESLLHAVVGMSGEIAEFQVAVYNEDAANVREELGDLFFYFAALVDMLGTPLSLLTVAKNGFLPAPTATLNPENDSEILAYLDLIAVTGELLDTVKKSWAYGKPLGAAGLLNLLYLASQWYRAFLQTLELFELKLPVILQSNALKLGERYPSGTYSDAAALARADKADGMGDVGCSTIDIDSVALNSEGGACD